MLRGEAFIDCKIPLANELGLAMNDETLINTQNILRSHNEITTLYVFLQERRRQEPRENSVWITFILVNTWILPQNGEPQIIPFSTIFRCLTSIPLRFLPTKTKKWTKLKRFVKMRCT